MPTRSQGSARPDPFATQNPGDTPCRSGDSGHFSVGKCAVEADAACDPAALDRALFEVGAPYVGITAQNEGTVITRDHEVAQRWLAISEEIATVAGTLRADVHAADVDPADAGAEPEAGQAAAEELIAAAEALGLPWLLRASGRSGGRHVLVAAPELAAEEWSRWCCGAAGRHGVGVTPRRTLRLLAAPHRSGLAAPLVAGTLTPEDLPAPEPGSRRPSSRVIRVREHRAAPPVDEDRSAREFGTALARRRAGWSAHRAYRAAATPGSKAAEFGELNWRRWVWSRVVTIEAAERGLDEDAAWAEFEAASRARARQLGRDAWRQRYWLPAVAEAATERPRRRSVDVGGGTEQGEVERMRAALRAVADEALTAEGRRPQFRRSVAAAVDAIAPVLVRRAGSLSERAWCEAAHLARSTLRAVLTWLQQHAILARQRAYQGGTADCARWELGARASTALAAQNATAETRTTGGTPPPQPPTVGRANPTRLREAHTRERQVREEEISALTETSVAAEVSPAAHRTARSLAWQRRWWNSLDPAEQDARRAARRQLLGAMHHRRRSAWLDWLGRRNDLAAAAERVVAARGTPSDHDALAEAPETAHRGLQAAEWRTQAPTPPELALAA
ncbi:hypothetical protein [Saccharopolyspora griseoalba]|uniref:Uncharacterized protein n=1 Tax=Saccharopolyspora griseoalba TaxID=1431848 RepID=A0ABW2LUJ9_9PSEU